MFRKKKAEQSAEPVERWEKIAAKASPSGEPARAPHTRRAQRSKLFRQATATLSAGEKVAVVIKDLSTTGCRIEFIRRGPLTPTLTIDEHTLGLHFSAKVVWQTEGAAGVKFLGADDEQPADDDPPSRLML
jgi:hypothetical protein